MFHIGYCDHNRFNPDYDKIDRLRGLEVSFVTSAQTDEECRELLKLIGMPFSEK